MVQSGEIDVSELLMMFQLSGSEKLRSDGASMLDAIDDGEITEVNMLNYGSIWLGTQELTDNETQKAPRITYGTPGFLDVVACRFPARGNVEFIKRITGMPGDNVELCDGFLYINGECVEDEKELVNSDYRVKGASNGFSFGPYYVPKRGDTLTVSGDSSDLQFLLNGEAWTRKETCLIAKDEDGKQLKIYSKNANNSARNDRPGRTVTVISWDGKEWTADTWGEILLTLAMKNFTVDEDYYFLMGDHRNNSNDSRNIGALEKSMILGRVERVIYPLENARDIR